MAIPTSDYILNTLERYIERRIQFIDEKIPEAVEGVMKSLESEELRIADERLKIYRYEKLTLTMIQQILENLKKDGEGAEYILSFIEGKTDKVLLRS